ncbi:MAG TPA: hypothetical protein VGM90_39980 [Kofleriaceae bacterium]|jgi:hypothetical protein
MNLVESVRVRCVLAAAAVALVGSATVLIATHHAPARVTVQRRTPVVLDRGCHVRLTTRKQVKPPQETTGDRYGDALLAIRPALDACMAKSSPDVSYRLSIEVKQDGSAESVDVRSEAKDLRKVSLKTTQCLERAASSARFPVSSDGRITRVSTVLKPDRH